MALLAVSAHWSSGKGCALVKANIYSRGRMVTCYCLTPSKDNFMLDFDYCSRFIGYNGPSYLICI